MGRHGLAAFCLLLPTLALNAAPPTVADKRLVIELLVQEPDIVTPTGLAVDEQGRVWVIENHTHQRPRRLQRARQRSHSRLFRSRGPTAGCARRAPSPRASATP